jgi:hypothetical protein
MASIRRMVLWTQPLRLQYPLGFLRHQLSIYIKHPHWDKNQHCNNVSITDLWPISMTLLSWSICYQCMIIQQSAIPSESKELDQPMWLSIRATINSSESFIFHALPMPWLFTHLMVQHNMLNMLIYTYKQAPMEMHNHSSPLHEKGSKQSSDETWTLIEIQPWTQYLESSNDIYVT